MVQHDAQKRDTMIYEKLPVHITFGTEIENAQDPVAEILLNNKILVPSQSIKDNQSIQFDLELEKDKKYKLLINRTNHDEKNKQVLSIKNFQVDGIGLNKLLDKMYFYPKYPALWHKQQIESGNEWPDKQKGWRSFGFNGQWIMEFETPFYTWLLANT